MHASSGILFNHESPRRGPEFVTRKISRAVARIALGLDQDGRRWATSTPSATGVSPATTSTPCGGCCSSPRATTTSIATGETHSIREFLDIAFARVGIDDWSAYVKQDPRFFRPAEVDLLIGDATKAREQLGWQPKVSFPELVAMMVDADLAEQRARRPASADARRRSSPASPVRTAATSPKRWPPTGGRCTAWSPHARPAAAEPCASAPRGRRARRRPGRRRRSPRWSTEVEPDEIYNLGGISSVALSWATTAAHRRRHRPGAGRLAGGRLAAAAAPGRPCGSCRPRARRSSATPHRRRRTRARPIAPVNPYGAAKAYAHHLVGVYRASRTAGEPVILFNHESPRRPDTFVTRKITKAAALIARGQSGAALARQPGHPPRLGLGPRLRRRHAAGPGHDEPGDYVVGHRAGPLGARLRRRRVRARRRRGLARPGRGRPALVRPADATELVGDATRARTVLGWAPTSGFEQMVARMVDADWSETAEGVGLLPERGDRR